MGKTAPTILWRIEVPTPPSAVAAVEETLEPLCMAVLSFAGNGGAGGGDDGAAWRVEGFAGAEPEPEALARRLAEAFAGLGLAAPAPRIERVPPRDWLAENRVLFEPFRIGRFYVHGSDSGGPAPAGLIPLALDAGAAFGSGEHPSTAACLAVIGALAKKRRFRRCLDMGCGSGILALAMAKTWRVPVVACDVDPTAVRVAGRNVRLNGVHPLVRTARGEGYRTPAVARGGPYDLIVANILARPLARMAGDASRNLARGGVAVLSGLLRTDARWIISAHRHFGLRLVRALSDREWQTLVMAR